MGLPTILETTGPVVKLDRLTAGETRREIVE